MNPPSELPPTYDEEFRKKEPNKVYANKIYINNINIMNECGLKWISLNWTDGYIKYPGMIKINVIKDESSLLHAVMTSIYDVYKNNKINKCKFIQELRNNLAYKLKSYIDTNNQSSIYYDTLSGGILGSISKIKPDVSLENMIKTLVSNDNIGIIYNEFISNIFNINIYIIDYDKKDLYMTGLNKNYLYKIRSSIVVLISDGYYDLVGLISNEHKIKTKFNINHPFIIMINKRMRELSKKN